MGETMPLVDGVLLLFLPKVILCYTVLGECPDN